MDTESVLNIELRRAVLGLLLLEHGAMSLRAIEDALADIGIVTVHSLVRSSKPGAQRPVVVPGQAGSGSTCPPRLLRSGTGIDVDHHALAVPPGGGAQKQIDTGVSASC
jgi:hypothetical protein